MRRARPYRGENNGPGKDIHGELDPTPGIREQPGSEADKATLIGYVRSTPKSGQTGEVLLCPLCADFVAKVRDQEQGKQGIFLESSVAIRSI
jgi:hypothetical protein